MEPPSEGPWKLLVPPASSPEHAAVVEEPVNNYLTHIPSLREMQVAKWETSKLQNSVAARWLQERGQAVSSGKCHRLMEALRNVLEVGVEEDAC